MVECRVGTSGLGRVGPVLHTSTATLDSGFRLENGVFMEGYGDGSEFHYNLSKRVQCVVA